MSAGVMIPPRFNGPPGSANGGYACGLVAQEIGPRASVRLSHPPPLGVQLTRRRGADGAVRLLHGDVAVAEGRAARPSVKPRPAPSLARAARATREYDPIEHPYPTCFVCGPQREDDGLRIFPGPVGARGLLAGCWVPGPGLASDGIVDPAFVWAALDCPSGLACIPPGSRTVLASLTAELEGPVRPGRVYIVTAWPLSGEGRKHRAASAVHDSSGHRVALAEALWITLRDDA